MDIIWAIYNLATPPLLQPLSQHVSIFCIFKLIQVSEVWENVQMRNCKRWTFLMPSWKVWQADQGQGVQILKFHSSLFQALRKLFKAVNIWKCSRTSEHFEALGLFFISSFRTCSRNSAHFEVLLLLMKTQRGNIQRGTVRILNAQLLKILIFWIVKMGTWE